MKKYVMLSALAELAMSSELSNTISNINTGNHEKIGYSGNIFCCSPIFFPKKHRIESYRSQQRRSKKRKP